MLLGFVKSSHGCRGSIGAFNRGNIVRVLETGVVAVNALGRACRGVKHPCAVVRTLLLNVYPFVEQAKQIVRRLASDGKLLFGKHLCAAARKAVYRLRALVAACSDCLVGGVVNIV